MEATITKHFHRLQIGRAMLFIKANLYRKLTLSQIASASGVSPYHFIRIFSACTGETPFGFILRERIVLALRLLVEKNQSITDIAHVAGFESSSSFNKAFKRVINYSPSKFSNLGEEEKTSIIYSLRMTPKTKEIAMNFEMNLTPEIINRDKTLIFSSCSTGGEFKDIAPMAWERLIKVVDTISEDLSQSEFLGVGSMERSKTAQICNYKAALSIPTNPEVVIEGLEKEEIPASKYAKFILKGTYDNVWIAFEKALQIIMEGAYVITDAPILENYLNDPRQTPEDDLLTEILIPIE